MLRAVLIAIGLVSVQLSPSLAETDFVVIAAKINPVKQPKAPKDVFGECARNEACAALAKTGAAYLGAPPTATSAAIAILAGDKPSGSEEGHFSVTLPKGYVYCHSQIHVLSVVPADGKRASILSVSTTETGLGIYTWTPKQGFGRGRSWVDADVTVYGVVGTKAKAEQAAGHCNAARKNILNCRGNGSGDRPGCKSVSD